MNLIQPMAGLLEGLGQYAFFTRIYEFISDQIVDFGVELLKEVSGIIGVVALSLLTLWIMIQGFRIVTGQSRDSMMALVVNSLRAMLIIGAALGMSMGGKSLYWYATDGLSGLITQVVTGKDKNVEDQIDEALAKMQIALVTIDALDTGGDLELSSAKDRAKWMSGLGAGGPALIGGTMLLLNKIAMALFTGLGPFFIMCLLFNATKPLFQKWLYYGIGTMFSLAVLSVMTNISLKLVIAMAVASWTGQILGSQEGISSLALQQGGVGMLMSMLIISAPPMAAQFFNGVMGQFIAYNQMGAAAGAAHASSHSGQGGNAYPPGVAGNYGGGNMGGGQQTASNNIQSTVQTGISRTNATPVRDVIKPEQQVRPRVDNA